MFQLKDCKGIFNYYYHQTCSVVATWPPIFKNRIKWRNDIIDVIRYIMIPRTEIVVSRLSDLNFSGLGHESKGT